MNVYVCSSVRFRLSESVFIASFPVKTVVGLRHNQIVVRNAAVTLRFGRWRYWTVAASLLARLREAGRSPCGLAVAVSAANW